jgi:hypothetical protein
MVGKRFSLGFGLAAVAATTVATVGPIGLGAVGATTPTADLSVSVSHDPSSARTGDEVTFTITARNDGPDTAADVLAGMSFDYPLQFLSADEGCSQAPANNSVVCTLGDVASGADASAEVTVRPMASGLYTVPVAVSSATDDPDAADRQATDALIVQKGPSQGERFVAGTYPLVLGRPADPGAIAYWGARFKAEMGTYPHHLERIPLAWLGSTEYRRLRIRQAYQHILKRAADPSALAYWVGKSQAGWSYQQIERSLMTSAEFRRLAPTEHPSAHPTIAYTAAVYDRVLGREASDAELVAGRTLLYSSPRGADLLVAGVQRSVEGRDVIIFDLYHKTLGHDPDPVGRYSMLGRLRDGVSAERLWSELLVSWEYLAKFPPTEDDYTYGEPIPVDGVAHDFRATAPDLAAALAAAG